MTTTTTNKRKINKNEQKTCFLKKEINLNYTVELNFMCLLTKGEQNEQGRTCDDFVIETI